MNARTKFGVSQDASSDTVKKEWHRLAITMHPDHGGCIEKFRELRDLYEKALAESQKPKKCLTCRGTRRVKIKRGLYSFPVKCPDCKKVENI